MPALICIVRHVTLLLLSVVYTEECWNVLRVYDGCTIRGTGVGLPWYQIPTKASLSLQLDRREKIQQKVRELRTRRHHSLFIVMDKTDGTWEY